MNKTLCQVALTALILVATEARGSTHFTVEERWFLNMFTTAGYSTAFGAALGAAMVGLSDKPNKLRLITKGASLGFIAGSAMGMYLTFQPILIGESHEKDQLKEPAIVSRNSPLGIKPVFSQQTGKLTQISANMLLAEF